MSKQYFSIGLGVGTKDKQGNWLEVLYVDIYCNELTIPLLDCLNQQLDIQCREKKIIEVNKQLSDSIEHYLDKKIWSCFLATEKSTSIKKNIPVIMLLPEDTALDSVPEAYLKLQLLSKRLFKPHHLQLQGLFGILPNNAWTNEGAIALQELEARRLMARAKGEPLIVYSIDKFPKMADYVVPSGVRIADTARVRLGAYLGEGTTVMHEGFVNFNAGTNGACMIEGRISAGVMIGHGSDLGGGCSTMGVLSGGNDVVISVGERCLIGANAGIGIPLGDDCIVEAGLYVTAATKVCCLNASLEKIETVKALTLAGQSGLIFRRNSQTGVVECLPNKKAVALNAQLHEHN